MQTIPFRSEYAKSADVKFAGEQGYTGVVEAIYTADHPEMIQWTQFFQSRFKEKQIFERFEAATSLNNITKATAIATQWYRFSTIMPWILCKAATMVSDNVKRHYVIQGAYEELGMRDVNEIHPERFRQAAESIGVNKQAFLQFETYSAVTKSLDKLVAVLKECKNDAQVMGLLLGLECPAEENVETLLQGLSYNSDVKSQLLTTIFFRIHRAIECEHIRLTISNFLRFNNTEIARNDFVVGFDLGIEFWGEFWDGVSQLTKQLSMIAN